MALGMVVNTMLQNLSVGFGPLDVVQMPKELQGAPRNKFGANHLCGKDQKTGN